MITRLELDGFKTFRDLDLDLAPFQAIVGANGVGKSNLLDALSLLARLVDSDLRSAFVSGRGVGADLFAIRPGGARGGQMRLAVEMLVEPRIEDDWGGMADLRYTRMRYEIGIERRMSEDRGDRFVVTHEALLPVQRSDDLWARRYISSAAREYWLPTLKTGRGVPFISTGRQNDLTTIFLHQDGRGGGIAAVAQDAQRTVLSTIANTEYTHAYAAREEMRRWRTISLDPAAIGSSGSFAPHSFIEPDGGNLASALLRMKGERPELLDSLSRDLSSLLPELASIDVQEDRSWGEHTVRVQMVDGRVFPISVLSGAALRLVGIASIGLDPDLGGVVSLEEPDCCIDPVRLPELARRLKAMSTDLSGMGLLRQLLVTTHSPLFVDALVAVLTEEDEMPVYELPELLFASSGAEHTTRFNRVRPSAQLELNFDPEHETPRWTLAEVKEILYNS